MLTLILLVAAYIPYKQLIAENLSFSPLIGSCLGNSKPGIARLGGGGKSVKPEWAGTRYGPSRVIWRVAKCSELSQEP